MKGIDGVVVGTVCNIPGTLSISHCTQSSQLFQSKACRGLPTVVWFVNGLRPPCVKSRDVAEANRPLELEVEALVENSSKDRDLSRVENASIASYKLSVQCDTGRPK